MFVTLYSAQSVNPLTFVRLLFRGGSRWASVQSVGVSPRVLSTQNTKAVATVLQAFKAVTAANRGSATLVARDNAASTVCNGLS